MVAIYADISIIIILNSKLLSIAIIKNVFPFFFLFHIVATAYTIYSDHGYMV